MKEVIILTVSVFLVQIVFIYARTINVAYIARNNVKGALFSGALIHISWLISIAIGVDSVAQVAANMDFRYIPVILASLAGGLIGTYKGMKNKNSSHGN